MKKIIFYIFCVVLPFPAIAKDYYVKSDGNPSLSGSSWGWASNNIQAIIDQAVAGDVVHVAVGTYSGGFYMKEGVTLKGGYTANRDNPTERYDVLSQTDPAKQTILDGGGTQRVITQLAPFNTPTIWEGIVIQNGKPSIDLKAGSIIYYGNKSDQIAGVLYKYDAEANAGMMFGREETQKQWGGYGQTVVIPANETGYPVETNSPEEAKNELMGKLNTQGIIIYGDESFDFTDEENGKSGNYAAYWCDTLTVGGYADWYLPAAGEMQEIYDSGVLPILRNIGKDILNGYWTSSHISITLGWTYHFGKEYVHPALKYVQYTASGVHPYTRSEEADSLMSAGGGVFITLNGELQNCIVKNNESATRGGGVYVGGGGKLTNCTVEGNTAPEGKEVYYEWQLSIPALPKEALQAQVYPNPAPQGQSVQVSLNQQQITSVKYQWINTSGLTIGEGIINAGTNTIKTPAKNGMYLLILNAKNKQYQTKIIIY